MQKKKPLALIGRLVAEELRAAFLRTFPEAGDVLPLIQHQMRHEYDYACPTAIKVFNSNKDKKAGTALGCASAKELAGRICESAFNKSLIQQLKPSDQGFIQITLAAPIIQEQVNIVLQEGVHVQPPRRETVVVDFSSPNIAKEMHVGHLRSTIIGECICRTLEFMGHDVRRCNHLGDWGTQFGMLISYMEDTHPAFLEEAPEIHDLDEFYKKSKMRFDKDEEFKKRSQETVVRLQSLDEKCMKAWQTICQVSRTEFNKIYKRLRITNNEFGESYYNPMIPSLLKELNDKQLLKESDGAQCFYIKKQALPLLVVKKDGGFNYDTTDLAAVRHRLLDIKADRCIYITDVGQQQHFHLIFEAAGVAGWKTTQRLDHMGFGLVLGEDGKKFSSRKVGGSVKLMDLLNEAQQKAFEQLTERGKVDKEPKEDKKQVEGKEEDKKQVEDKEEDKKQVEGKEEEKEFNRGTNLSPEEYEEAADKLGMASIKYYDLKQNRITNYEFSYKKMLDPKGNTAVYLVYAYVRICSIIRKSGIEEGKLSELAKGGYKITHPQERKLGALLIKFAEVVNESVDELALNRLTDYIYAVTTKVQENYKRYRIVGDEHMESRLMLCVAIKMVLDRAFYLLGIEPLTRI